MGEDERKVATQSPQTEQVKRGFQCTGNCLNCVPAQRAYCASQHAYSNMKVLDMMMTELLGMKKNMAIIAEKVEAIQNSEAEVFDPNIIAQKGDGAE